MGLDMYLRGRKFFWGFGGTREREKEDGFDVEYKILDLGYWRKEPDLHGYIVQTYADGVDECQEIELDTPELKDIIRAIEEKRLPKTTGFFFGESDGSADLESIEILKTAIQWLETKDDKASKSIFYRYRASW